MATVRSYPTGNELSERALRDLAARLAVALPLRLGVGSGSISDEDGAAIPVDEGMSELAAGLYRDGVRQLRLEANLVRPELDRFISALAAPLDSQSLTEDYVTRLWEAELPNVSVVALDPYLDRDIPGDVLEGKERPTGEVEGVPTDLRAAPPPPEEAFRLSDVDRENLASDIAQARGAPPWRAFVAALLEVADSPVAERRQAEIISAVEAGSHRFIQDGELALAALLLRSALEETRLPRDALDGLLARFAREDRLASLREIVQAMPSAQPSARELCLLLGPATLPVLSTFLATAVAAGSRRFWAETIGAFGREGLERLTEILSGPDGESAAAAARVIAAAGDASFGPALWQALAAASGAPRRELLRAALALQPDPERLLDIALKDADADCRLIALTGLHPAPSPAAETRLLERITTNEGRWLQEREKDALHRALAGVGDARALEYFAKQLSGGWLTRADRTDQTRAARSLARMASPRAAELLEEKAAGRGVVAEICQRALRERAGRAS